ncbi:MAG TPA: biotin transporter BioY [Clostridia bacterium]|nr:biotin transporter BioY [Clostridia bacterium]
MKITAQEMTRTALFTALICIASFILKIGGEIVVPFSILPFMVLLTGGILGSRLGALSVTLYVLIGLLGVPVFAQSPFGGLAYIFHPTFGFLLGFILAAYLVGLVVEKIPFVGLGKFLVAMLVGIVAIYIIGIPYLYGIIKFYLGKPITMWGAIEIGLLPFIVLDLIKGLLAGVIAHSVIKRLKR